MRELLRRPSYRHLLTARTVSQWGDAFNTVALVLLVYSLTGSGLAANSGLWTAALVSQIVLAPLAGVVVATLGYTWAY